MFVTLAAEIALACAALWGARITYRGGAPVAAAGFILLAGAALAGTADYAGLQALALLHGALSTAAGWAGLALIACGAMGGPVLVILGAAALTAVATIMGKPMPVNLAALILLNGGLGLRFRRLPYSALAGTALLAGAGAFIGTHGTFHGVPRIDLYHAALALGLLVVAHACVGKR